MVQWDQKYPWDLWAQFHLLHLLVRHWVLWAQFHLLLLWDLRWDPLVPVAQLNLLSQLLRKNLLRLCCLYQLRQLRLEDLQQDL